MPSFRLSDLGIQAIQPRTTRVDYWDTALPTFGVRVSPKGGKVFIVKLYGGRRAIGRYPLISLSEARTEAKKLLAAKTLRPGRPSSISFNSALNDFLDEKRRSRRPGTVKTLTERLNRHFTFKGQLGDFTHAELVRRLKKIPTNSEHDHALAAARTFFTWAHNRRYIDDNPTRGVSPYGHTSRARVLSDEELKAMWIAADQIEGHFSIIVKLLILTGCRRGEIAAVQSSWIDEKENTLTIPPDVTKNGHQHVLPLGNIAKAILSSLPDNPSLFFPARGKSSPFNGWSKSKALLDKLIAELVDVAQPNINQLFAERWTLHDLRRTFATRLAEMGIQPHVIERLLNHVSGQISGVAAIYNRASYLSEMRGAIEKWETHLTTILE